MTEIRTRAVPARLANPVRRAAALAGAVAGGIIGWQAAGHTWWLLLVAAMTVGLAQQTLP